MALTDKLAGRCGMGLRDIEGIQPQKAFGGGVKGEGVTVENIEKFNDYRLKPVDCGFA